MNIKRLLYIVIALLACLCIAECLTTNGFWSTNANELSSEERSLLEWYKSITDDHSPLPRASFSSDDTSESPVHDTSEAPARSSSKAERKAVREEKRRLHLEKVAARDDKLNKRFELSALKRRIGWRDMDLWRITKRWPDKSVPISFTDDFPESARANVYEAMDKLNNMTCVKFTNSTNPSEYHVKINQKSRGCFSHRVGKVDRKGYQNVTLHSDCFDQKGRTMHVLMHVLGLHHQENRPDRDDYVVIHKENIAQGAKPNFRKIIGRFAPVTAGLPYDYGSIMHSQVNVFSNKKGPTMSIKKPYEGKVGQRYWPSNSDIAMINRLYECHDHYIGDEIPEAIPYAEFHAAYMSPQVTISDNVHQWIDRMKEHEMTSPVRSSGKAEKTVETLPDPSPADSTEQASRSLSEENARLREENEKLIKEKAMAEDQLYQEKMKNKVLLQEMEELDSVRQENEKMINKYIAVQQQGEERNRRQFASLRQDIVELGRYIVRKEERERKESKSHQEDGKNLEENALQEELRLVKDENQHLRQTIETIDSLRQENDEMLTSYLARQKEEQERNRQELDSLREEIKALGAVISYRKGNHRTG